jgi:hypothetical protein
MMQTFTQDDLVRHLYTEESPQQGEAVDAFISSSEKISHNFDDFCLIKSALNDIHLEPSEQSVKSILCYSALSKFALKK